MFFNTIKQDKFKNGLALFLSYWIIQLSFGGCTHFEDTTSSIENQNVETPDLFITSALSVLEELSNYYPPDDIDLIFAKTKANGVQQARFRLNGKTKEIIELGSFAEKSNAKQDGTTCTNKWQCGKAIKSCLDEGFDAVISNGECETPSAWCVTCVDSD